MNAGAGGACACARACLRVHTRARRARAMVLPLCRVAHLSSRSEQQQQLHVHVGAARGRTDGHAKLQALGFAEEALADGLQLTRLRSGAANPGLTSCGGGLEDIHFLP